MSELSEKEIQDIVDKAIEAYLVRMGIESEDPRDMQSDMIFIRKFRQTTEAISSKIVMVIVGVATLAGIGGIWMAIRKVLGL